MIRNATARTVLAVLALVPFLRTASAQTCPRTFGPTGPSFRPSTSVAYDQVWSVPARAPNGWTIAWSEGQDIYARRFDLSLNPLGSPFLVNSTYNLEIQDEPAIAYSTTTGNFLIAWSERHGYDFNGYLFRHPTGNLVVDPVDAPATVFDELARIGVARIVLTNRNHTRASAEVRRRTGARVAIHPADAAYARSQGATIDDGLDAGEWIGPFIALGVEGKSPGEVALYWPERRLLDECVGIGTRDASAVVLLSSAGGQHDGRAR
jgi:hypothetical protein